MGRETWLRDEEIKALKIRVRYVDSTVRKEPRRWFQSKVETNPPNKSNERVVLISNLEATTTKICCTTNGSGQNAARGRRRETAIEAPAETVRKRSNVVL